MATPAEPSKQPADRLEVFDALYASHAVALHDYLLGRTGDAELARDLLQEICIRAWRSIGELCDLPSGRQRAWLFTVARNLVVDFYRRRAAAGAAHDAVALEAVVHETGLVSGPEAAAMDREDTDMLDNAIARLPETLRTVLVLHVLGDRTSAQVAELLGRPAGTVRYQLAQARRLLASELRLMRAEEQEVRS